MAAERYASLANLQEMLTDRVSAEDSLLRLLDSVSTAVERHCGRVFTCAAAASERLFRASETSYVSVHDIADADTATVSVGGGSSWTQLDDAAWWLSPDNAAALGRPWEAVESGGRFPVNGRPSVRVSAVWGWPAVPGPVTEAVLLLASRLYSRRSTPTGVAGFGDYGVVRIASTDRDVESQLEPYVRIGFGA